MLSDDASECKRAVTDVIISLEADWSWASREVPAESSFDFWSSMLCKQAVTDDIISLEADWSWASHEIPAARLPQARA